MWGIIVPFDIFCYIALYQLKLKVSGCQFHFLQPCFEGKARTSLQFTFTLVSCIFSAFHVSNSQ